jgi:small subunit ribosomal protein S10
MKCSIKLKSFNHITLESISQTCLMEAKKQNLSNISLTRLPKKVQKFSLIRSPHVHKKSREQFEIIHYKRLIVLEGCQKILQNIIDQTIVNNKNAFHFKINYTK